MHTKQGEDKKVCVQKDSNKNKKINVKKVRCDEVKEVLSNVELTEKQRLFCIYYIENFNATRAYKRAYKCDYRTANTNGSRMLVNASIKLEIDRLTDECLQEKWLEIEGK